MPRPASFWMASATIAAFVLVGLTYNWLPMQDPTATSPFDSHLLPSVDHWFGTDKFGRDVFARVVAGSRTVIVMAPLTAAISVLVGGLMINEEYQKLIAGIWWPTLFPALAIAVLVTAMNVLTEHFSEQRG